MNAILCYLILGGATLLALMKLKEDYNMVKREFVLYMLMVGVVIGGVSFFVVEKYDFNNYSLGYMIVIYFLTILSINDIKEKSVPVDEITIAGALGFIMLFINPNVKMFEEIIGIVVIGFGGIIINKLSRNGIGIGDILVLLVLNLLIGWKSTLTILLFSLVIVGIVGFLLLVFRKVNRKTKVPFVPFLLLGTLFVIFV